MATGWGFDRGFDLDVGFDAGFDAGFGWEERAASMRPSLGLKEDSISVTCDLERFFVFMERELDLFMLNWLLLLM